MKFVDARPYADPATAAHKLLELANAVEPVQDSRIHIEKINGPFLFQLKVTPAEYKAGLDLAIAKGWLWLHESGTFVKFTKARTTAAQCPPLKLRDPAVALPKLYIRAVNQSRGAVSGFIFVLAP